MPVQNQPGRAEKTRTQLIRAAESLIAKKGIENVSVREIVREAGQKNESALQYHFKSRDGLIIALQTQRIEQLESRRSALVAQYLHENPEPGLRDACALLIQAPFLLCREDKTFREYLGAFGQQMMTSGQTVSQILAKQQSSSFAQLNKILHNATKHLDNEIFELRFEAVSSFLLLSLSRRARDGGSFRGRHAEIFFNNLADLMAAMLSAPTSNTTQGLLDPK